MVFVQANIFEETGINSHVLLIDGQAPVLIEADGNVARVRTGFPNLG
jgi:hypothetical protein